MLPHYNVRYFFNVSVNFYFEWYVGNSNKNHTICVFMKFLVFVMYTFLNIEHSHIHTATETQCVLRVELEGFRIVYQEHCLDGKRPSCSAGKNIITIYVCWSVESKNLDWMPV